MTKQMVRVIEDEWYPVYSIDNDASIGVDVELTEDEIEFIKKAEAMFEEAQTILKLKVEDY